MGLNTSDDAAVYRLNPELALIQTVDFFTPVVDDPYMFGQIAAANALSDVYAMGGQPLVALNIVCFPSCLDAEILRQILLGGADKVREAGAVLAGGHSIDDNEPKYGLAVTGTVKPDEVWTNASAKDGDVLILTKPIGTGVFMTANKVDLAPKDEFAQAVFQMAQLNAAAAVAAREVGISACTDITGFGLLGHAYEMASGSDVRLKIYSDAVPLLQGAVELARQGMVPGGTYRNREHLAGKINLCNSISSDRSDLLFDPQTSGGLLLSVPAAKSTALLDKLTHKDILASAIGEVVAADPGELRLEVL